MKGPLPIPFRVSLARGLFANLAIHFRVSRLPGIQTVHIAVEHAEGGGDQHGIVNLLVGGAVSAGNLDILLAHVLPAFLYFACNREQRFHLV